MHLELSPIENFELNIQRLQINCDSHCPAHLNFGAIEITYDSCPCNYDYPQYKFTLSKLKHVNLEQWKNVYGKTISALITKYFQSQQSQTSSNSKCRNCDLSEPKNSENIRLLQNNFELIFFKWPKKYDKIYAEWIRDIMIIDIILQDVYVPQNRYQKCFIAICNPSYKNWSYVYYQTDHSPIFKLSNGYINYPSSFPNLKRKLDQFYNYGIWLPSIIAFRKINSDYTTSSFPDHLGKDFKKYFLNLKSKIENSSCREYFETKH